MTALLFRREKRPGRWPARSHRNRPFPVFYRSNLSTAGSFDAPGNLSRRSPRTCTSTETWVSVAVGVLRHSTRTSPDSVSRLRTSSAFAALISHPFLGVRRQFRFGAEVRKKSLRPKIDQRPKAYHRNRSQNHGSSLSFRPPHPGYSPKSGEQEEFTTRGLVPQNFSSVAGIVLEVLRFSWSDA
jgi:hypothetical protein